MLPNPLHAAIVHFPVVLAVLLPLVAVGALIAIRRGSRPFTAWGLTSMVATALLLSSWAALETGEAEEETVEDVVSERVIGGHEEAAQFFTTVAGGVLLLTVAGLANGKLGAGARLAATIGTFAVVAAGVKVGHSGGQLVYKYGAGAAYADANPAAGMVDTPETDRNAATPDATPQIKEGAERGARGGDNDTDDR
ncbi:MAG: hypothetical protein U0132_15625 [Gemmatimonadaceae bacterium]